MLLGHLTRSAALAALLATLPPLAPAALAQDVPRRPTPPSPVVTADVPAPAGPEVTVAEAVARALDTSPELARAALARDGRALAISAARADRLPLVTAQVSPQQRYGLTFDNTIGDVTSQTTESLNAGVGAQVTLYDGGRRRARVAQARLERDAAQADLARAREQVALDVAQRFLQVLLDQELLTVQAERLAAAETQRARVSELLEAGAVPRGDLIAQDAVVARARTAVVEARGAARRDRAALVQAVGLDPLVDYAFVGPGAEALAALAGDAIRTPLAELLARAQAQRSDRARAALDLRAAQAGVGVARAASRPRLDASANLGTGYSSLQQRLVDGSEPTLVPVTLADGSQVFLGPDPLTFPVGGTDLERTPFGAQLSDNRSGSIALTLSVPLFDRFETRRATEQARIASADARFRLDALDRQIAAEVQQAVVEAETSAARVTASQAEVAAAREALRVERDRYALGAGTLFTVAEAQTRLAEAQSGLAQAAYNLAFRRALVRLAVGDVDPGDLSAFVGL